MQKIDAILGFTRGIPGMVPGVRSVCGLKSRVAVLALLAIAGGWSGAGCGREELPEELRVERMAPVSEDARAAQRMTLAQRLGIEPLAATGETGAVAASQPPAAARLPVDRPFLEWQAPEGWRQAEDRPMRVVTFFSVAHPQVECYVALLPGMAGGLEANFNRWIRQMGKPPLTEAQIAALPRIAMLDQEAPLLEVPGDYQGMTGEGQAGSLLLGAAVALESDSVFVKLIGPEADALAEKDAFIRFCASLVRPESL